MLGALRMIVGGSIAVAIAVGIYGIYQLVMFVIRDRYQQQHGSIIGMLQGVVAHIDKLDIQQEKLLQDFADMRGYLDAKLDILRPQAGQEPILDKVTRLADDLENRLQDMTEKE